MPVASNLLLQHLHLPDRPRWMPILSSNLPLPRHALASTSIASQHKGGWGSIPWLWQERMARKGFLTLNRNSAQCRRCRCLWMLSSCLVGKCKPTTGEPLSRAQDIPLMLSLEEVWPNLWSHGQSLPSQQCNLFRLRSHRDQQVSRNGVHVPSSPRTCKTAQNCAEFLVVDL